LGVVNLGCEDRLTFVFCAVFSYEVVDAAAFERVYGPAGEWARFFRGGEGYLGTELLRSAGGYLVIDRWTSREAYAAFLASHRDEYARRSAETERLYAREERLGEFEGMPGPAYELRLLPGRFAVCRLAPDAPAPERFWSLTRTDEELSVICAEDAVPRGASAQRGWRALEVAGPLDFALTGVAAAITTRLALAGISLLPVATYDTDYFFVREATLDRAAAALEAAGHTVGTHS
jgi:heme-degrading monooxygenase HmoA